MKLDDYKSGLEEAIGTIETEEEQCPGVYYIRADQEDSFPHEYYAVLDGAPFAAQVQG